MPRRTAIYKGELRVLSGSTGSRDDKMGASSIHTRRAPSRPRDILYARLAERLDDADDIGRWRNARAGKPRLLTIMPIATAFDAMAMLSIEDDDDIAAAFRASPIADSFRAAEAPRRHAAGRLSCAATLIVPPPAKRRF